MNSKVLGVAAGLAACLAWDVGRRMSTRSNRGIARGKRFLILGGGFAGTEACRELERLLPGHDNGQITLVDQHDYLLFTPMLTEAVGGVVDPPHIATPLRHFAARTKLVKGEVTTINLAERSVSVDAPQPQTLQADYLILSLGANSNYHHIPGAEQSAIPMKRLSDAHTVRDAALALVKSAAGEHDATERAAMLTFLVAGGGYTGVETIAALNDLVRETAGRFTSLDASQIRMIIVEPTKRIMNEVTEDLAAYTQRELERSGIEVLVNIGVKSADGDRVTLTNGREVRTKTFIWTAGVQANKLVAGLDAPKSKSKALKVTPQLAVAAYPGVWAVGDCAAVPQPDGKDDYGATAQNATREGKLVAQNIVRELRGAKQKPFTYKPIGELALVGRRRGVARVYNHNFSGFVAYAMWRGVYLAKLPSVSKRLRVLSDWVIDAISGPVGWQDYKAAGPQNDKVVPDRREAASA